MYLFGVKARVQDFHFGLGFFNDLDLMPRIWEYQTLGLGHGALQVFKTFAAITTTGGPCCANSRLEPHMTLLYRSVALFKNSELCANLVLTYES